MCGGQLAGWGLPLGRGGSVANEPSACVGGPDGGVSALTSGVLVARQSSSWS